MKLHFHWRKRVTSTVAQIFMVPFCCLALAVTAAGQLEDDIIAEDDAVFIQALQPVTINVLANDIDVFGHTLTVTQVTQGAFGSVAINSGATTVTYTPDQGFVDGDAFTYEVSDGTGLTAFAEATITLGAPPPPRDTKGTYNGLIQGLDGPAGFITVKLTTSTDASPFTGTARFSGKTFRFQGSLVGGTASVTLPQAGTLSLTLVSDLGFNTITGQVSFGAELADFVATQLTFSARVPTPKAGKYTLVADVDPASFPAPEFPQGATWAKVTITKAGLMRIRGKLGDGTALSASAIVRETSDNPSGDAPLIVTPYSRRTGIFAGLLTFAQVEDPQSPDFEGDIHWVRPPSTKGLFPDGFTLDVKLIGARFNARLGGGILGWSAVNNQGQFYTDDGNQPNDVLNKLLTLVGNKFQVDDPGPDKLKIVLHADGTVIGSFVIEGQQKPTRITGVVIQKFGDVVEGQFLGRGPTRAEDQTGWFGIFPGRDADPNPPPRVAR